VHQNRVVTVSDMVLVGVERLLLVIERLRYRVRPECKATFP
jgi:hypothetical protein